MNCKKIIIMAGGSGGHVFPGLTVARFLIKQGWHINWIGTKNNIESKIVPQNNIQIHFIKIKGLRNASFKNLILSPVYILRSYYQVKKIMQNWSPDVVLGMGGYVSGPGGIAAWKCKIPFILHEQNKIAGIANKWLSKISTKNMQAYFGALDNAEVVGNPVCEKIINIPSPIERFKNRTGPLRILVIGGSQGASILNHIFPKVSFFLKEKIIIWHQTGKYELIKTKKKYEEYGFKQHTVTCFINNIASAYEWADIAVCRSGALTVSEISIVGLAAIFIPYPHHDKQQHYNAEDLVKIGAARMIDQSYFNTNSAVNILHLLNRNILFDMAKKAYSLGIRNSTLKIFNIINSIVKNKNLNKK